MTGGIYASKMYYVLYERLFFYFHNHLYFNSHIKW
jgi:hypothetical protein